MKIAVVLNVDRHYDPQVSLYSTPALAIEAAKKLAQECNQFNDLREREGVDLPNNMQKAGWLYHATYGEAETITVFEQDVDA